MKPIKTEFLAGFRAENHTFGLEEGYNESQVFMRTKIRDWVKADIGGSKQVISASDTGFSKETFKQYFAAGLDYALHA